MATLWRRARISKAAAGRVSLLVGAQSWTAAGLSLGDTAGNVFATFTQGSLTSSAEMHVGKTGAAVGAAWFAGGAVNAGLTLSASTIESAGADISVRVTGWVH